MSPKILEAARKEMRKARPEREAARPPQIGELFLSAAKRAKRRRPSRVAERSRMVGGVTSGAAYSGSGSRRPQTGRTPVAVSPPRATLSRQGKRTQPAT